jgi:hypothetical protein
MNWNFGIAGINATKVGKFNYAIRMVLVSLMDK